jgi:peroxiredoxin
VRTARSPSEQSTVANFRLAVGDIAPDCILAGPDGIEVNLRSDSVAGNPIVLIFCPELTEAAQKAFARCSDRSKALTKNGARLFAITQNKIDTETTSLDFPVLLDRQGQIFGKFNAPQNRLSTVVLRRNHHVAGIFDGNFDAQISAALSLLEELAWERNTVLMHVHPPVLLVPDVFSRADCIRLINRFETEGQEFLQANKAADHLNGSDYKMRVHEHMREDRIDHFFFDKDTVAFLANRLNRVVPEIFKAFHYHVTKYETLRVACYKGQRGGLSHGHRDNVPPTTYRRFAMSINLNTEEFEGGELRFPEFGDQRYRPEAGTAIVFSSSLLHEAMHVTSGRRFVFLAFLFGDADSSSQRIIE